MLNKIIKITKKDVFLSVSLVVNKWDGKLLVYIEQLHSLLKKHFTYFEILIFDNGTNDFDLYSKRIQNKLNRVRLMLLSRNYQDEIIYSAILENSIGDYVCILQPELYRPSVCMKLFNKVTKGFDIVNVEVKRLKYNTFWQKLSVKLMSFVFSTVLHTPYIPEKPFCGILTRMAVNSVIKMKSKKKFLRYSNYLIGLKSGRISFKQSRGVKILSPGFLKIIISGLDLLVSNSKFLLRFSTYLGLLASFLSFIFLLYVLLVSIIKQKVIEGWITSSIVMGSLFLIMFLILTILSEYVARILAESKNEPIYFISKDVSSSLIDKKNKQKLNIV